MFYSKQQNKWYDYAYYSKDINGMIIELPRKEYDLLKALMEQPERVLNREQLLTIV